MKTYSCDRCYRTLELDEIVGTEFDYRGYKTLTRSFAPIRDVCPDCYREIMDAMKVSQKQFENKPLDAARKVALANAPKRRGFLGWFL